MKILVKVVKSGKTGAMYSNLMVDLGYRKSILSWESSLCAELLDIKTSELLSEEREYILYDSENPILYEV